MSEKKNKTSKLLPVVIFSMVVVILGAITKTVFHSYMISNTILLVGMIALAITSITFILKLKKRKV